MRKSRTMLGTRLRAGIAVAAVTAAVVAGTAVPAYAAAVTIGPTQVSTAAGTPIYFYGGTLQTKAVRFISAGSCPTDVDDTAAPGQVVTDGIAFSGVAGLAWITAPALAAGTWTPCFYAGTGANAAAYATDTTADTITAMHTGSLSATSGAANARITLTVPTAAYTTSNTFSSQFISGVTSCPSPSVAADSTHLTATTTRASATSLTVTVPAITASTQYLVCVYSAAAAGSTLLARSREMFSSFSSALPTVTISPTGGSSGVATNLLVSATSAIFTGSPQALVSRNACKTTRPDTSGNTVSGAAGSEAFIAATTKITTSKLAVSVPTSVLNNTGDVTTPYNVCLYAGNTTGDALLTAPVNYAVAPVLSLASAQFAVGDGGAGNTASGPAQGGSTITVSGVTGVPTQAQVDAGATLTANLGGSPINITRVNANGSFTGTTTSHAPGAVKLAVTTAAGTVTAGVANYTYSYGITVVPNTAGAGSQPVLDIAGAGFGSLSFADACPSGTCVAANAAKSYVLLTDNTWYTQDFATGNIPSPWVTATPPVALCNSVLVISDAEIICTLDLTKKVASADAADGTSKMVLGSAVPAGSYTITIVNDSKDIDAGDNSIVSSGSTFTVAPF